MRSSNKSWPPGNGEMARRIRQHDWEATPLGPPERWPDRVRALVELMLESPEMTSLMWGADAIQLYNDAYAAGIGDRHPEALGRSALVTWTDVRAAFEPLLERAWAGESVTARNVRLDFSPGLPFSEGWFDLTYTPVRDERGEISGIYAVVTETTERVRAEAARAEAALAISDEKYRTLFDSIDQGFCTIEVIFDDAGQAIDYRFLEINPAFARTTGLENAAGRRMRELVPAHEEHWYRIYGQVAETREAVRFEAEAAALDRWYNVYAYPIGDPDQHRVAVLFEDITGRREAFSALWESESRYRTLIQNLPDYAIFLLDPNGVITEWSEGAERIAGYTTEEALGKHIALVYPDEAVAAGLPEQELAEAAAVGRVEREGWLMRKGGERFWGHEIVTAIHEQSGNLLGFTKISRDLTERRHAEEKLLASEERVRAIVETATDYAIFTVDANGRIQDWFPGAEAVFGWSAADAVGQPFAITFTAEDRANGVPEQEFQQARQTGSASGARWRQHENGSRVFIESVVWGRYDLDGEFLGMLKIGRDVTERRLAEQQRIEREAHIQRELRAQVAAATVELRALSHRLLVVQEEERRALARELHDEIGQMLTGLSFTLSTAAAKDGQLAEAQRIVTELTGQVRQLSMDLRPTALDAYGVVPALRGHVERYERQTGIMVDLRAEGPHQRFPAPVEITAYRIVQEALTNVARHSQASDVLVQLFADEHTLTVSIRDTGIGFDPADVSGATGLGGMRERAELLGGRVEIDASPGAGSLITAELPLSIERLQHAGEAAEYREIR
jgi:PAS domain S-box-containing protein